MPARSADFYLTCYFQSIVTLFPPPTPPLPHHHHPFLSLFFTAMQQPQAARLHGNLSRSVPGEGEWAGLTSVWPFTRGHCQLAQHGTQHPAIWCHHIRPASPDWGSGPVLSCWCERDRHRQQLIHVAGRVVRTVDSLTFRWVGESPRWIVGRGRVKIRQTAVTGFLFGKKLYAFESQRQSDNRLILFRRLQLGFK